MFEHKHVHKCTWHQEIIGHWLKIHLEVMSDLWSDVLDSWGKRGVVLSTDHHLLVSWIR